jgi:hypothetical protein
MGVVTVVVIGVLTVDVVIGRQPRSISMKCPAQQPAWRVSDFRLDVEVDVSAHGVVDDLNVVSEIGVDKESILAW